MTWIEPLNLKEKARKSGKTTFDHLKFESGLLKVLRKTKILKKLKN